MKKYKNFKSTISPMMSRTYSLNKHSKCKNSQTHAIGICQPHPINTASSITHKLNNSNNSISLTITTTWETTISSNTTIWAWATKITTLSICPPTTTLETALSSSNSSVASTLSRPEKKIKTDISDDTIGLGIVKY